MESIGKSADENIFDQLDQLSKITKTEIPKQILDLGSKNIRFNKVISKSEMKTYVLDSTVYKGI